MNIEGKKIAILISPRGTEESEFTQLKDAVENAGGTVTVVSSKAGTARTVNNDLDSGGEYTIDKDIEEVSAGEFDGLVIPGGCIGADTLRGTSRIIAFVRAVFEQEKPVGAICHASWLLVEAGALKGRKLTSYPTLRTDLENEGATWTDEKVIVGQGLVTSRDPDDLPALCDRIVKKNPKGNHRQQARSA